jgi:hypothetical protein
VSFWILRKIFNTFLAGGLFFLLTFSVFLSCQGFENAFQELDKPSVSIQDIIIEEGTNENTEVSVRVNLSSRYDKIVEVSISTQNERRFLG